MKNTAIVAKRLARASVAVLLLKASLCLSAGEVMRETPSGAPAPAQNETPQMLPPPTEAQLTKGREILKKISHVVKNIPLQEAAAVMQVFSFTELHTMIYPSYVIVRPKGRTTKNALPVDLVGSGFTSISVEPIIKDDKSDQLAFFSARMNTNEACISLEDVKGEFGQAAEIRTMPIRDIHPVKRSIRKHDTGHINFGPLRTPAGVNGVIEFRLEYQTCAASFSFVYSRKAERNAR